jgi:hypothetical protein
VGRRATVPQDHCLAGRTELAFRSPVAGVGVPVTLHDFLPVSLNAYSAYAYAARNPPTSLRWLGDTNPACTIGRSRLHSIPEPRMALPCEGLVTSELVCGAPSKEVPMGNSVKRSLGRVVGWLEGHHVLLVITLSLFHVGLSCIHVRDSGGNDSADSVRRSRACCTQPVAA